MEEYPEEFRTPPLALVALCGGEERLAGALREHLRGRHQPPINALAAPPAGPGLGALFPPRRGPGGGAPGSGKGVLSAGWLARRRERLPAAAAVLLPWRAVAGDPTSWASAMGALDAVRAAAERRGVRLCVAVEAPEGTETAPELPEDRAAAIRQRGDLEARAVICLALADAGSLRRFGRLLHELCISHYRDEAQRARLKLSELGPTRGPQACCRWCIKIATMAECCQDWGAALNFYRAAYQNLAKAVPQVGLKAARSTPLQTGFELAAVAELLHAKLTILALHQQVVSSMAAAGQGTSGAAAAHANGPGAFNALRDAMAQFQQHMALFKAPAWLGEGGGGGGGGGGPQSAARAAHWGFVARQHLVFGQLIDERLPGSARSDSPMAQPGYYFECAASAAIRQRAAFDECKALSPRKDLALEEGPCIGQVSRQGAAGGPPSPVSDEDFLAHLHAREAAIEHSRRVIDLLQMAQNNLGGTGARFSQRQQCLMAEEYMRMGEVQMAQGLLLSAAATYRREGWDSLLAVASTKLRKCAQQLRDVQDHLAHSFEVCSLEHAFDFDERCAIQQSALALIQGQVFSGEESVPRGFHFQVGEGSPLTSCFSCAVGFLVGPSGASPTPGSPLKVAVAIQSRGPLPIPIRALEAEFSDPACDRRVEFAAGAAGGVGEGGVGGGLSLLSLGGDGSDVAQSLVLRPSEWKRCVLEICPEQLGHLQCNRVRLFVGDASQFEFEFHSLALPGSTVPEVTGIGIEGPFGSKEKPFKDGEYIESNFKGLVVEEASLKADMSLSVVGPILVDGLTPVTVTINASDCGISNARLNLTCEESDTPTQLVLSSPGMRRGSQVQRGSGGSTDVFVLRASAGGGVEIVTTPLEVPDVQRGSSSTMEVFVKFISEADVVLFARLTCDTSPAGSEAAPARACLDASVAISSSRAFRDECQIRSSHGQFPLRLERRKSGAGGPGLQLQTGLKENVWLPSSKSCMATFTLSSASLAPVEVIEVSTSAECDGIALGKMQMHGLPARMAKGDRLTGVFQLHSRKAGEFESPGTVKVKWRALPREVEGTDPVGSSAGTAVSPVLTATSQFDLPPCNVAPPSVMAVCTFPQEAVAGEAFKFEVDLANHGGALLEVGVKVSDDASFIFSGTRNSSVPVLPGGHRKITWDMVPVVTGQCTAPDVSLSLAHPALKAVLPGAHNSIHVHPHPRPPPGGGDGIPQREDAVLATGAPLQAQPVVQDLLL